MKIDRFLILGSGGSGTSLLRGLLNAHNKLFVMFENMKIDSWDSHIQNSNKKGLIWGNKLPVQKMNSNKIFDKEIEKFINDFHIIWVVRRPKHFDLKLGLKYRAIWHRINTIYWNMKDAAPDKIINVSYEDLLLFTVQELKRICSFLGVVYDHAMLKGVSKTGHRTYEYGKIIKEKAFK